jgi:uncharacterized protein (TIGR03435 family)
MQQLADYLGELMDRSVIDRAALDGKFNLTTAAAKRNCGSPMH